MNRLAQLGTLGRRMLPGPWSVKRAISTVYWLLIALTAIIANRYAPGSWLCDMMLGLSVGSLFGYALATRWGCFDLRVEIPTTRGCLELCAYAALALSIVGIGRLTTLGQEAYIAAATGAAIQYLLDDGQL